ncbi:YidC/Oxa1 family insertase periplasmic-domain containing protein [Stieleria sp. JC731]|uniref:YidC/Oxa1 family insertase periplasmic-domain containing protein n=1 Tax=Pirellulaceae TaxID=2691357 RepID=UPI001E6332C5|nr:YidC/Oxa1 family insertase periplasmic-domain containing protein [Stieleria sp. JC731]MCC9602493.1 YidC/Oxa1 family insertase periplasmic-domain containing protein [Stieleria sp. JC731]
MDRRTYTFLVLSAAFFFLYMSIRNQLVPPQNAENDVVAEAVDENADQADAAPDASAEQTDEADPEDGPAIESSDGKDQWYTIGSMDPNSNHNLLITFRNRGGAIERIEVTKRDSDGDLAYRRVDTKTGYLGYFAGTASSKVDGVTVNVVGPGTPAAIAKAENGSTGIKIGDVIVAVGETPIQSTADIDKALDKTEPGDSITVEVLRETGEGQTPLKMLFDVALSQHPLDLVRLAEDGGEDQVAGNISRLSCLMTLAKAGQKRIPSGERYIKALGEPSNQYWQASTNTANDGSESIVLETTIGTAAMNEIGGQPVKLKRTFKVSPSSYVVDMDIEVANIGDKSQELSYRVEGANGITLEGWWYSNKISPNWMGGAAARDIVYRTAAEGHRLVSGVTLLKEERKSPEDPFQGIFASDSEESAKDLKYIGIDAQYFAVAYMPPEGENSLDGYARAEAMIVADEAAVEKHKERAVNTSFALNSKAVELAPGESFRQSLQMFAGPKEPELLAAHGISDFIYYGWFGYFSTILSGLLHVLRGIVGNYAVAIILLTVIVRGAMFPLSRNAAVNAQKMQELAPELKKIAEKYKDDMEGRLKAQQALQKRVGFNPLAGCLPMFLQLPIFMGLYRALSVDIDLRQKPFWSPTGWASNLAAPDQFMYWGDTMGDFIAGRGTGWLGPYLNILPLIVVVLFITQQKLFMPPATDEQTAMTQKMMTFMTLFMGLFFFRVPAGLCLYFIASSLWGIGERLLVKKTLPKGKHFDLEAEGDVIDAVGVKKKESGKQSLAERLVAQMQQKEPEAAVVRPNKRKRPPNKKK